MSSKRFDALNLVHDSLKNYVDKKVAEAQLGGSGSSVDLSRYATKDELNLKVNSSDISSVALSGSYNDLTNTPTIPTKVSELQNDAEYAYQPNFTYKIVMISEGQEPSVSTTGVYPDLVITFNIPRSSSSSTTEKMYFGWIPFDQEAFNKEQAGEVVATKTGFTTTDEIGANMTMTVIQYGLDNKSLTELDAQTLGKTSTGAFNPEARVVPEAAYVCVIYPKSKNYVVTMDNGVGDKVIFEDKYGAYAQNGLELTNKINGITYCQSGLYMSSAGEVNLYVDEQTES